MKLDKYNRELEPGQVVVWATGWSKGPRIGIVKKICNQRIRISYNWKYKSYTGEYVSAKFDLLQQPDRLIVIDEQTPQTFTMELLKG
jgi:hypothetical protein